MKNYRILFALFLGLVSFGSYAQDTNEDSHSIVIGVPEVALLDLEATNGTSITLAAAAPTEAGLAGNFTSTDNSIWMNYSSIIGSTTEPSRKVTVQITSGTVPTGTKLVVVTAADAGNGEGTMGTAAGGVRLTNQVQDVVTGIGSAYTGDGVNNGHNLFYRLGLISGQYENLDFDSSDTVVVTYTLSDS